MSKMDEQIVVVKRSALFNNEALYFDGVLVSEHADTENIVRNMETHYEIMRRGDAEENPDYKQIIPYCLIRKGDEVFVYKRLKAGGETRLHDSFSIGVGGHMNDLTDEEKALIPNYGFSTVISSNLERELEEELEIIGGERELEIFGLINDDSNEVGKVHLGLLVVIDLSKDASVEVRETDQLEGSWVPISKLHGHGFFEKLENWSQIAVKALETGGDVV